MERGAAEFLGFPGRMLPEVRHSLEGARGYLQQWQQDESSTPKEHPTKGRAGALCCSGFTLSLAVHISFDKSPPNQGCCGAFGVFGLGLDHRSSQGTALNPTACSSPPLSCLCFVSGACSLPFQPSSRFCQANKDIFCLIFLAFPRPYAALLVPADIQSSWSLWGLEQNAQCRLWRASTHLVNKRCCCSSQEQRSEEINNQSNISCKHLLLLNSEFGGIDTNYYYVHLIFLCCKQSPFV